MRATTNDPFRLRVDRTSPAKGRIRLLLEAGLRPGKPDRPARFSGRPLRGSPLACDKDCSTVGGMGQIRLCFLRGTSCQATTSPGRPHSHTQRPIHPGGFLLQFALSSHYDTPIPPTLLRTLRSSPAALPTDVLLASPLLAPVPSAIRHPCCASSLLLDTS
jgi:hypothetical protein